MRSSSSDIVFLLVDELGAREGGGDAIDVGALAGGASSSSCDVDDLLDRLVDRRPSRHAGAAATVAPSSTTSSSGTGRPKWAASACSTSARCSSHR